MPRGDLCAWLTFVWIRWCRASKGTGADNVTILSLGSRFDLWKMASHSDKPKDLLNLQTIEKWFLECILMPERTRNFSREKSDGWTRTIQEPARACCRVLGNRTPAASLQSAWVF